MVDKLIELGEFTGLLRDGMVVGIGGWAARRKPMALVRAICRSDVRDLTVVSYGGPDVGLLCASGKVKKLVFGFVSLDEIPLDPHFRAAREAGEIEVSEYDEGMLYWGLYAAALRLPFLPTRAGLGSDIEVVNPDLKKIKSPYGDDEVIAMPPIRLDLAVVHANRATRTGVGQILGVDPYFDDIYCMAADVRVVSCEQLIDVADLDGNGGARRATLNRMMTDHVVVAPGGAHPTSCDPDYPVDTEALAEYADRENIPQYLERLVNVSHEAYVEAVGFEPGSGSER